MLVVLVALVVLYFQEKYSFAFVLVVLVALVVLVVLVVLVEIAC